MCSVEILRWVVPDSSTIRSTHEECPAHRTEGQLTFGFPHWSHFAYLAGGKRKAG